MGLTCEPPSHCGVRREVGAGRRRPVTTTGSAPRRASAASSKSQAGTTQRSLLLNRVVQAMALRGGCVGGDMDECRALRAEHPLVQIADVDLGADVGHVDVDLTCSAATANDRNRCEGGCHIWEAALCEPGACAPSTTTGMLRLLPSLSWQSSTSFLTGLISTGIEAMCEKTATETRLPLSRSASRTGPSTSSSPSTGNAIGTCKPPRSFLEDRRKTNPPRQRPVVAYHQQLNAQGLAQPAVDVVKACRTRPTVGLAGQQERKR